MYTYYCIYEEKADVICSGRRCGNRVLHILSSFLQTLRLPLPALPSHCFWSSTRFLPFYPITCMELCMFDSMLLKLFCASSDLTNCCLIPWYLKIFKVELYVHICFLKCQSRQNKVFLKKLFFPSHRPVNHALCPINQLYLWNITPS